MDAVTISDLSMEYVRPRTGEHVLALDGVTISIEDSSFVSIVGPSGCGKSTLLLIVDGLIRPTRGSVSVDGHAVSAPGRDRAMVFQEASLFPWFTTLRNCTYGLESHGVPRVQAEERVRPLLTMVGLRGFERHYPGELSVGMQQRANLARAIAVDPRVLLMDEPFAALDAQTRELMQAELLNIWAQTHKTVLFITHQIDEAIYLSDRVIVMSNRPGRVLDDIPIDLPRPRSLEVKRTAEFADVVDRIWKKLESEVKRGADFSQAEEREAAR